MNQPPFTGEVLDGRGLAKLLSVGIRHLFRRRDYLNRINVFPVPDGDTGTNLAFTFKTIFDALGKQRRANLPEVLGQLTEAALDGARGNSGAIMAQYLQGFREAVGQAQELRAEGLASACEMASRQAWTAMSEPVQGTMPNVMEGFSRAVTAAVQAGTTELAEVFRTGLDGARVALANTPNQLPALKHAGVVDAGGQGFVDLLEGMDHYLLEGQIDPPDEQWQEISEAFESGFPDTTEMDLGEHQFCTECVIQGPSLSRERIMTSLQELDHSSLVVAGSAERVRVHIHVNNPSDVFLECEKFGEIAQQKAEDMSRQHGLMHQPGEVAVVTDTGGDVPVSEIERLGLHMVPVRLNFGDREYIDGISLKPVEFYRMLQDSEHAPKTSQPPGRDFRRVFELLTVHGYEVLYVGLSSQLSGTFQSGKLAAERMPEAPVTTFDSLNASCGQGLLSLVAAEAAAAGSGVDEITSLLTRLVPLTTTMALPDELVSAVRGGRVPGWLGKVVRILRVMPVLVTRNGKLGIGGIKPGRGVAPAALAKRVLARLERSETYRFMVSHCDNAEGARQLRRLILEGHPRVHSCHLTEAGPALGVHLGRGGLLIGFLPDPPELAGKT